MADGDVARRSSNFIEVAFACTEEERQRFDASLQALRAGFEPSFESQESEERLSLSNFCDHDIVMAAWMHKERLDYLFDYNLGSYYYLVRANLFVADKSDASPPGGILEEILLAAGLLPDTTRPFTFVDLCGGLKATSDFLLRFNPANFGWGMTLDLSGRSYPPRLLRHQSFVPVRGRSGDGDVYQLDNIVFLRDLIQRSCDAAPTRSADEAADQQQQQPPSYVIADGLIPMKAEVLPSGEKVHKENLQELFSLRLILSEILAALHILADRGHFICKIFDTLSDQTASLIFMVAMLFDSCTIIKPAGSRQGNSEKYLVGRHFRKSSGLTGRVVEHLTQLHTAWPNGQIASVILPGDALLGGDVWPAFQSQLRRLNEQCLEQQQHALQNIMDTVAKQIPVPFALSYRSNIDASLIRLGQRIRDLDALSPIPAVAEQQLARLSLLRALLCRDSQILSRRCNDAVSFSVDEDPASRSDKRRRVA